MTTHATLYYEVHVTLDPVNDLRLPLLKHICDGCGFRIANLIMRKGGKGAGMEQKHTDDSFLTTRGNEYEDVVERLQELCRMLNEARFVVRRYKIEDTVIDSALQDTLELISKKEG